MAKEFSVQYNPEERTSNRLLGENVPVVRVSAQPGSVFDTFGSVLDKYIAGFEAFINQNLKNLNASGLEKFISKLNIGGVGGFFEYNIEVKESLQQGASLYEARAATAGDTVATNYVSGFGATVGAAIARTLVPAALTGLGITLSAPAAGALVVGLAVGGAIVSSSWFDDSLGEEVVNNLSKKLADFLYSNNDPSISDLNNQGFVLVLEGSASLAKLPINYVGEQAIESGQYTVLPVYEDEQVISLYSGERVIFQGDNLNIQVNYENVQEGDGLLIDLKDGTTRFTTSEVVKDYLGEAVTDVIGTVFNDVILAQDLPQFADARDLEVYDNLLFGNQGDDSISSFDGNDFIYGGDGNDTLTGSDGTIRPGGFEKDILFGGAGADTFILAEGGTVFYTNGNDVDSNPPDFAELPVGTFITPKDFAALGDFNPGEGDKIQLIGTKEDYFVRAIKNDGFISAIKNQQWDVDTSALNPESFSTSILGSSGELIAIIPNNLESGLNVFLDYNPVNESNVLNAVNFV